MMKRDSNRGSRSIYQTLSVFVVIVIVLIFFSDSDPELRQALEEKREFLILSNGEHEASVRLEVFIAMEPQEFTTSFDLAGSGMRETVFKGVELRFILETYNIDASSANEFLLFGLESSYQPITRDEVEKEENVYVCYSMDGEIMKLQSEGGLGPFVIVVRDELRSQRLLRYVEAIDIR